MQKNKLVLLVGALAVTTLLLVGHLLTSSEPETSIAEDIPAAPAEAPRAVPDAETILAEVAARRRRQADAGSDPTPAPEDLGIQQATGELSTPGGVPGTIAVFAGKFEPVNFEVRATSSPQNLSLSQTRPESIRAEPRYAGEQRWYGVLKLGSPRRYFPFVLDLTPAQHFQMWFDANANGDLNDDSGPLKNKGSGTGGPGGFATLLEVPWQTLAPGSKYRGSFRIWFYINKTSWASGRRASHYSMTQLKGEATINGRRYLAWIADSGYNDADLTNDGLLVDLNGNGKADADEWFADIRANDKRAATARGRVEVRW